MSAEYINQQLLVAVSSNEAIGNKIIGASIEDPFEPLDDGHFSDDEYTLDLEPGLYVWEGSIGIREQYQTYKGIFRRARVGDLLCFGLRALEP